MLHSPWCGNEALGYILKQTVWNLYLYLFLHEIKECFHSTNTAPDPHDNAGKNTGPWFNLIADRYPTLSTLTCCLPLSFWNTGQRSTQRKLNYWRSCQTFSLIRCAKNKQPPPPPRVNQMFPLLLLLLYLTARLRIHFNLTLTYLICYFDCVWIFNVINVLLRYDPVPLHHWHFINICVFWSLTQDELYGCNCPIDCTHTETDSVSFQGFSLLIFSDNVHWKFN